MGSCLNVWSSWTSLRILKTDLRPCHQRPSAWNQKIINPTCAWESVTITLVGSCWCLYAVHCFVKHMFNFSNIWAFGPLHWLHMFTWCTWWDWWEKLRVWMAGMKQEMQVGRGSKHSKYLMHSHLYLDKMWQFQPDQRCQPTRTWKLRLVVLHNIYNHYFDAISLLGPVTVGHAIVDLVWFMVPCHSFILFVGWGGSALTYHVSFSFHPHLHSTATPTWPVCAGRPHWQRLGGWLHV